MGDTLSRPIVDKASERHENDKLLVGISSMQGWRCTMEDAHLCVTDLPGAPEGFSLFGVFDGHCGRNVAKYCAQVLATRVVEEPSFQQGDYSQALTEAFLGLDEDILKDPKMQGERSGSTAVVALITPTQIYCANAGDSRCVLCQGGKATPLSFDHKPNNEGELKRIKAAGGFVSMARVNGNLALSRAIGDFEFKQNKSLTAPEQAVTSNPDVIVHNITKESEFIVLACDGVWDVMTNDDVVAYVRKRLTETQDLALICEEILDKCLAPTSGGLGCDNMTMVLVQFADNSTQIENQASASSPENTTGLPDFEITYVTHEGSPAICTRIHLPTIEEVSPDTLTIEPRAVLLKLPDKGDVRIPLPSDVKTDVVHAKFVKSRKRLVVTALLSQPAEVEV